MNRPREDRSLFRVRGAFSRPPARYNFDMSEYKPASIDDELETLRKRSEELIAEAAKINNRIDELAARVKQSPAGSADPATTDTWVEEPRRE